MLDVKLSVGHKVSNTKHQTPNTKHRKQMCVLGLLVRCVYIFGRVSHALEAIII
jgi:hypothetical protein